MAFDMGLWDRLFGKKMILEVPVAGGGMRKVKVTVAWWEEQKRSGAISQKSGDFIRVHVANVMNGIAVETWEVGKDIPEDMVAKCRAQVADDTDFLCDSISQGWQMGNEHLRPRYLGGSHTPDESGPDR